MLQRLCSDLENIRNKNKTNSLLDHTLDHVTVMQTIFKKFYLKCEEYSSSLSNRDEKINDSSESNLPISAKRLNIGHLIGLTCGHNGSYSNYERDLLINHLNNAGFIL